MAEKLPRIVRGMPAAVYRSCREVSRSDLDLVHRCPALFKAKRDGLLPEAESPALAFGTLVHCAILEPDAVAERYAVFDGRRGTKAHKEALATAEGRELVKTDDLAKAQAMAEAVRAHPAAAALLAEGEAEVSCFWEDSATGIRCKARLDWITPAGDLLDLKTTTDASPQAFGRACWYYSYHRQSALYLDGARACGLPARRFVFVVIEKDPPHLVAAYELDALDIELGRDSYRRDLATLAACLDAEARGEPNPWPAYGDGVQPLSLPPWAYRAEETEEE